MAVGLAKLILIPVLAPELLELLEELEELDELDELEELDELDELEELELLPAAVTNTFTASV